MVSRSDRVTAGRAKQDVYYSDFLDNLDVNPSTGILSRVLNENSVKQAIKNLILTDQGERLYQPTVGGNVRRTLFEPLDGFSADSLKDSIRTTVFNSEPRVSAMQVDVTADEAGNSYRVSIQFQVKTLQTASSLEITLTRNR